jgi:hypothetical protein
MLIVGGGACLLLAGCGGEAAPTSKPPLRSEAAPPAASGISRKSAASRAAKTRQPSVPPAPSSDSPGDESPMIQTVYRPADTRPVHDDQKLAQRGIHRYESRRLRLYTDIDAKIAAGLPGVIDQAYEAWEAYFGPLPPDRARRDFQITGYIMADRQRFEECGLIPRDLPPFLHGRHRGAEFWMHDQSSEYYRRHLMIHEATHCFMTIMPNVILPAWYLEGMAELFGMHDVAESGKVEFRVLPANAGHWGRIRLMQEMVAAGAVKGVDDVTRLKSDDFLKDGAYAWAWGLCQFLDGHPRYRMRFRELARQLDGAPFGAATRTLFVADAHELREEWLQFAVAVCYGYDFEHAAIEFRSGMPLAPGETRTVTIAADRGWQASGAAVAVGKEYEVVARGRYMLAAQPKPWDCEPQGISFRYFDGEPLGRLMAAIRPEPVTENSAAQPWKTVAIGRRQTFVAASNGTVYFRVNDFWNELADNAGTVEIEIREISPPSAK